MWNAFVMTGNTNFNIEVSNCDDFDNTWDSGKIYDYVINKIVSDQPFIMPDEVIYIRDKKGVKNIRIHKKKIIF